MYESRHSRFDLQRLPVEFPPAFARAWGDDAFGVWAYLVVSSKRQRVVQRLRWIEPGSFLMGSPPDEPGRSNNESPLHRVTLTQGFWLADTACTQALWLAVMGKNPSHFQGAELPVDGVSRNDVQHFLEKLANSVPGIATSSVVLPTEAQWEYACRAGTQGPFSFGHSVTPEQVNYHSNYPYDDGQRGIVRGATVPVKSLPPNPWGLYEMHGNVWEWCQYAPRVYSPAAVRDPSGAMDGRAPRAVRGGSWVDGAGNARSACRFRDVPGFRFGNLGFRLCSRAQSR